MPKPCFYAHFCSPNPFPRSLEPSHLFTGIVIDPCIPGPFNPILHLDDCRYSVTEELMAVCFRALKVRNRHLCVSVAAKSAFVLVLADVKYARMAEPGLFNGGIHLTEPRQHLYCSSRLILDSLYGNNPSITPDYVPPEDPWLFRHLII